MTGTEMTQQRHWLSSGRKVFLFVFQTPGRVALGYLASLALAESATVFLDPRLGMVLHGLVLGFLLIHASLWARGTQRRFLLSLTLAPLIRLLSLSLPLPDYPIIFWYMVVGIPLFLATYLAARTDRMNPAMLGLTLRRWPLQILVGLSGVFLAVVEYLILKPTPLVSNIHWYEVWLPALILLVFTGFLEELIFRGMIQYTAVRDFGRKGLIFVAAVFAVLHFGYYSIADVLFVFTVGLFFGWVVVKTGSILGVTLAHGLTNIGLYLIIPFLLSGLFTPTNSAAPVPLPPPTGTPTLSLTQIYGQATSTHTVTGTATRSTAGTATPSTPALSAIHSTTTPAAAPTHIITPTETFSPTTLTPTQTPCVPPAGWVVYIVQAGDTLSSLSARTGYAIAVIQQKNCLSSDRIYTGQKLYLPANPSSRTPTASLTPTSTPQPSQTPVPTNTITLTPSPEASDTPVPTLLPTNADTPTPSFTETVTQLPPTATASPSFTNTPTPDDNQISK